MRRFAFLLASSLLASPAFAAVDTAEAAAQPATVHGSEEHDHHDQENDIVVTAPFVRDLDLLAGKSVLSGDALTREVRTQIGETLVKLPGVSATSFSPGASRPVLRGFQGERVRVLTDGLGSIDVSNTSADHAVTIDPLTAERIEVLRGPAALLFGGQAIGGAVNVIDRRIPRAQPRGGVHAHLLGALGSAGDERSIGGALDLSIGNSGLVAHVDGSFRKTDDLRVGGSVLAPALRAEQRAIAAEELAEGHEEEAAEALARANARGRLANSATEQSTLGAGLAYIKGPLSLGVSVSRFRTDYGVPTRPGAEHHHEEEEQEGAGIGLLAEEGEHGEEAVSIGLRQDRYDLRGEYELGGGLIDRIRLRIGAADYTHTEFEGDEVGTVFDSKGVEGRVELVQANRDGWRGATGAQFYSRKFDAVGAEAFLRANETNQFGVFTLQEFAVGKVGVEAAARFERTDVDSQAFGIARDYNALSGALGVHYDILPAARVGLNLSRTTRAPSAEELFSDGPHIATSAYEIGNPDLRTEKALGGELFFRIDRPGFSFNAAAYVNRFDDFIYEGATGEEEDELPVFRYLQRDATHRGFEIEASAKLFDMRGVAVSIDGVADYVRATLKGGGPVPRIPPLRLLGGIEARADRFDARAEVEWVDSQDRIAAFETRTDGHTLVNAALTWHPRGRRNETALTLSANNIFDVDARRHASFTKDFVPLAGRDIRLAAHFAF
nr:TonB-dependent receptor [uncultured Sphingomonas sp.]